MYERKDALYRRAKSEGYRSRAAYKLSELQRRLQGAPAIEFLKVAKELGASDLYITSSLKPMIRLHGRSTPNMMVATVSAMHCLARSTTGVGNCS